MNERLNQRLIVSTDRRIVIPQDWNDLQASGKQVPPTEAVVESARILFVRRLRSKKNAPSVEPARGEASLGIDVEPAEPLPRDLVPIVATATELARYNTTVLESRILFCAKEAVFKALHPLCGLFLDFHEIEIDLDARSARVRHGHCASISFAEAPRVVALAVI